jgi:glucokinase
MAAVAGVDLGGTKIQTVIVDRGKVVGSARRPTPRDGAEAVIEAIAENTREAMTNASVAAAKLTAVGVGSPGSIDAKGGVANSPNVPGFEGHEPVPMGPELARRLGEVAVKVDNDVRVALLGEWKRGAGRPFADLLGVFVGTGVGGGLVIAHQLVEGRGAAGELGHTIVKEGGRRCGCGGRGHLEAYGGRAMIEAAARLAAKRGKHTRLFEIMERRGRDRATSAVIAEALRRKDPLIVKLIDQAVWALGIALANAQNLLDVEAIIVGGGLGDRLGPDFVKRVAKAATPRLHVPERPPQFLSTELGDLSGAVGAAVLAGG